MGTGGQGGVIMGRSCLPHLATLQAHGLTPALLERFASFVAQGTTGAFLFHTNQGQILPYEEHHKGRVAVLEEQDPRGEDSGTRVS